MMQNILTTEFGGRLGNILLQIYTVYKYANIHNINYDQIFFNINYTGGKGCCQEKSNLDNSKNYLIQNFPIFSNIKTKFVESTFFKHYFFKKLRNNQYYTNTNIELQKYNWLFPESFEDINLFRQLFYNDVIINELKNKYPMYCNKYALHIRRGDFEVYRNGKYLETKEEIVKKINNILKNDKNAQFIVFSNDINWCKNNINKIYNIEFHSELLPYQDLFLLSICKNILCNKYCSYTYCAKLLNKNINEIPKYIQV